MLYSLPGLTSQQLLDRVNAIGPPVTPGQLRAWQQYGLIPGPEPFYPPGFRGSRQLYSEDATRHLRVVADAVRQLGDLGLTAWRLWFAEEFVSDERIRLLLRHQIERVKGFEIALDVLDRDDSDDAWRLLTEWERRRPENRVVGVLRGALRKKKEQFTTFVIQALRLATGTFDCSDLYESSDIINVVLAKDEPRFQITDFEELSSFVSRLSAVELQNTLASYSNADLRIARSEIKSLLAQHELLKRLGEVNFGNIANGLCGLILDGTIRINFKSELHSFLLWLSITRLKEGRDLYTWIMERSKIPTFQETDLKLPNNTFI